MTNTTHEGNPFVLNAATLDEIVEIGNRMAADAERLERLIWAVKAESLNQLNEAARAYTDAFPNMLTSELIKNLRDAADRSEELEKLWNKAAYGVRNRVVYFGDLPSRGEAYEALSTVFQRRQQEG